MHLDLPFSLEIGPILKQSHARATHSLERLGARNKVLVIDEHVFSKLISGLYDLLLQAVKKSIDLATADWTPRKAFLTV